MRKKIKQFIYNSGKCGKLLLKLLSHGGKVCIICENKLDEFLPSGIDEAIFKKHHIVGGCIGKIAYVRAAEVLTESGGYYGS